MFVDGVEDAAALDRFFERCEQLDIDDPERLHLQAFPVVIEIARC